MRHKYVIVPALLVLAVLPLTGCGGGGSSTVTNNPPITTQYPLLNALDGTYSASWSLPGSSQTGTFQFTITPVNAANDPAVQAIQFTSVGTMPPNVGALSLQASPYYNGEVTTVTAGSTTSISQVEFQPYVAQPSYGSAYVILNISPTNVITGTINNYAAGITNNPDTPYILTVTKVS